MLDTITGEGTEVRFIELPAGTLTRPADFATTALKLPELTSSDQPVSVSAKADPPSMYGSASASGQTWTYQKPGKASWTMSLSGDVQPTTAERAAMRAMQNSTGKLLWVERKMNTSDKWEGGVCWVSGTGLPVGTGDAVVTFSVNLTGYGPKYPDTSNIA